MFILLRKMTHNGFLVRSTHTGGSYEEAIKVLYTLQSNAAYLQSVVKHDVNNPKKMKETEKYLLRSGITLEQLDRLSVIHVAGTKGKGTTCAFMEAILRQYGFSTGFFSSPHLVSVRERIRLNGEPISQSHFAHYFWDIYRRLEQKRECESDMPTYFKFLTILSFHVFLEANIDVAILEVGIGGELDSTNVVRNPVCVGITSLGLEHTLLLGNTIEEIAYQKSGIFKPHAAAFTVLQPELAMRILQKRAAERRCRGLRVVPATQTREWNDVFSSVGLNSIQQQNASLSISMALEWMKSRCDKPPLIVNDTKYVTGFHDNYQNDKVDLSQIVYLNKTAAALASCKWPGRTQILRTSVADFFLDGAHTVESIDNCISWFKRVSRKTSTKFLIFNITGNRDSLQFLKLLKSLDFDKTYFTPTCVGVPSIEDMNSMHYAQNKMDEQRKKCEKHCELWGENSVLKNNVSEVLVDIKRYASLKMTRNDKMEVLVTGSLHLIGAVLTILDPNLTMSSDF
ncbi:folylpolyglutamate synthase, mitochondrial-like [Formica exsecta]|uniref:folylpolyglutamate synthase, mitochondrial-like n=1 Tax=Formica exsecta TaxID=72781 RepID=UPI0011421EED|nr:folylpolyglutamate synthase, mitochondrial-like [Formica exsecta]